MRTICLAHDKHLDKMFVIMITMLLLNYFLLGNFRPPLHPAKIFLPLTVQLQAALPLRSHPGSHWASGLQIWGTSESPDKVFSFFLSFFPHFGGLFFIFWLGHEACGILVP